MERGEWREKETFCLKLYRGMCKERMQHTESFEV